MMRALAAAKVNLSLRVGSRSESGLHRIDGIFQSISWFDRLELAAAEEDVLESGSGGEVIAGWDNLAWRALSVVRDAAGATAAVGLRLSKEVPAAAGLGGGSADAAAALALGGRMYGVDAEALTGLAASLGSDVPFCFTGGTARVRGTGEQLEQLDTAGGFALAVLVPPIELATGPVYDRWDDLGGPVGPALADRDVPPALRGVGPIRNDLWPAASDLAPGLEEWRAELAERWSRPVLLTGSGPSLFAFGVDAAEAAAMLGDAPPGARSSTAASPIAYGWAMVDDSGEMTVSRPQQPSVREELASRLAAFPPT